MLNSIIISTIAGVLGTGLGGIIALILGKGKKIQSLLFSLTAGIMLAIVCFELLPHALVEINVLPVALSVIFGALLIYFLENYFSNRKKETRSLFFVALAIALHNLPEALL